MKIKLLISNFIMFILVLQSFGQNYQIFDVNTSNFPIIEAKILTYDSNYLIDSLKSDDIQIIENDQNFKPLEFTAPKSTVLPTSIVLVLDISASMAGYKFEMLKKTAKQFICKLPLEISEVAVASFSNNIILNCDFTHNITTIENSIDNIELGGGTNFDNAFLTPFTGAVSIASQGKFKKLIIFITDGLSTVKTYAVANSANFDTTVINCITIGLPISDELVAISKETGGRYYSDLNVEGDINKAFEKIYSDVQVNTTGKLKWKSLYSCQSEKTSLISLKNEAHNINFQIPPELLGTIETIPSTIVFDKGTINTSQIKPVFLRGNNIGLIISSVSNTNNGLFGTKEIYQNIYKDINEIQRLDFTFTPKDSIYAMAEYTIKIPGCPDIVIDASSGGVKKLKISHPHNDDNFVRGGTVPINWSGVNKTSMVDFYFQEQGKSNWIPIGYGTKYSKSWVAPAVSNKIRIKGQITNNITLANLMASAQAIIDTDEFKAAFFSPDGTEILTQSVNGVLKNWATSTVSLNYIVEKVHLGTVSYFPNYNRLVTYSDDACEIFTNRNGLSMVCIPTGSNDVKASFTHVQGNEMYISLKNFASLTQYEASNSENNLLSGAASPNSNFAIIRNNSQLLVYTIQPYKKRFSIKLDKTFENAILHNNKEFLAINYTGNTLLFNLLTKNKIAEFNNETFEQFDNSGNYLLTHDSSNVYINDLETGNRLSEFSSSFPYIISDNGSYLAYLKNDSLLIKNLLTQKLVYQNYFRYPAHIKFFPKTDRLLMLQSDSLTIINLNYLKKQVSVFADRSLIKMMDIAPNEESILITTPKAVINWKIENNFDSDTTPYFNILMPEPAVLSEINFGKQYLFQTSEKTFTNLIVNPGRYDVLIDSIFIKKSDSCFTLVTDKRNELIEPKGNLDIEMQFTPNATGNVSATLCIVAANKLYKCKLLGEGIHSAFELLSKNVVFPDLKPFQQTDTLIPVLKNTGTELLKIEDIFLNPNNDATFSISKIKNQVKLNTNDTLWAKINFSPKKRGRKNTTLYFKEGAGTSVTATNIFGNALGKTAVIIAGKTMHSVTKNNLKAGLEIRELHSGRLVTSTKSSNNGDFMFELKTDLNYSIAAQLNNFFSSSVNIDLTDVQTIDTIWVDIYLTPIQVNSTVVLNNIFFEFAKADLLDISKSEMQRLITLMNNNPDLNIEIQGHTDNIGTAKENMALSALRANAVKNFLIANNIAKNRISVTYFGEEKPIQDNFTERGRKANRRVEIKFMK